MRRLAGLDAAPEPPLGGDEKMLVEGIGRDSHFHPFAAAGDDRERGGSGVRDPHVVLKLSHMLLRWPFFREGPWQHELGLEHSVEVVDEPVERGGQEATDRVLNPALDVINGASGVPLIPGSVE